MSTTWRLTRLRADHDLSAFSCGRRPGADAIDVYLRDSALAEQEARLAAVWVVENPGGATPTDRIVGFFTLSPVSVQLSPVVMQTVGVAAPSRSIGGWLLGRMGISQAHQGAGLGRALVASAIVEAKALRDLGAGPLLVVDPKNDALLRWYLGLDFGFVRLAPNDPRLRRLALKL